MILRRVVVATRHSPPTSSYPSPVEIAQESSAMISVKKKIEKNVSDGYYYLSFSNIVIVVLTSRMTNDASREYRDDDTPQDNDNNTTPYYC